MLYRVLKSFMNPDPVPDITITTRCTCRCGEIEADISLSKAWGGFICHCTMCPDKTYQDKRLGSGMAFIAVPTFTYGSKNVSSSKAENSYLLTERTSNFAQRSRCKKCNSSLTMQYDCEPHTTWITLDFGVSFSESQSKKDQLFHSLPTTAHIHCPNIKEGEIDKGADEIIAYHSWEPWLHAQNPCKPDGVPPLEVCLECFLPKTIDTEINYDLYKKITRNCKC